MIRLPIVTGLRADYTQPPSAEKGAIRHAAKLALDERDDELAARLIDLLRRDR